MDIEFIEVTDAWGQSIPLARPLAEQAAATGQAVAVWLTPDACRAALSGKSNDPREGFSPADKLIARVLAESGESMKAAAIAFEIVDQFDHLIEAQGVRDRFRRGLPLRRAGYTTERDGYAPPVQSRPAPLDHPMRLALRRLKRGDATTAQLAAAADRTTKTVANWVAEDGPLYARGVRRVRKGVYTWPNAHDVSLDDE